MELVSPPSQEWTKWYKSLGESVRTLRAALFIGLFTLSRDNADLKQGSPHTLPPIFRQGLEKGINVAILSLGALSYLYAQSLYIRGAAIDESRRNDHAFEPSNWRPEARL